MEDVSTAVSKVYAASYLVYHLSMRLYTDMGILLYIFSKMKGMDYERGCGWV